MEHMHLNYSFGHYPFYLKPTFWNRWGPMAWVTWLAGGKLPGDDSMEFRPQGYSFDTVGPPKKEHKGKEEMLKTVDELLSSERGGCPFF